MTTMKVTRTRRTHATKLKELDDLTEREDTRLGVKVGACEVALVAAREERTTRLAELADKRARIVADARAQAASLLEQIEAPLK